LMIQRLLELVGGDSFLLQEEFADADGHWGRWGGWGNEELRIKNSQLRIQKTHQNVIRALVLHPRID
jgi:hypothetical protein